MKNYSETIDFLFSQLPMYQRIGAAAYKADLKNTYAICELLGQPQEKFKSVHVAGTNGKGSTSHMIASVLQEAGYKVGLYTSPHLKDFRERIKINGRKVSKKYVVKFVDQYKSRFKKIEPSFFELTMGMAFKYFEEKNVDVAVIEVGMGGRLDSTNIITPELSVITNIGYDHMKFLGDTLPEIAKEKAGIIKHGVPVIIGERNSETDNVFEKAAVDANTSLYFANDIASVKLKVSKRKSSNYSVTVNELGLEGSSVRLDLLGSTYQSKNLVTVLAALKQLKADGEFKFKKGAILRGLSRTSKNTGLLGRWQVLQRKPIVIADVAHNVEGVRCIMEQLNECKYNRLHIVWGMVTDKDVSEVMSLLPQHARYYFAKADIPRAMPVEELFEHAKLVGLNGMPYVSVKMAVKAAKENAGRKDLVYIGGSTFVVAEAL